MTDNGNLFAGNHTASVTAYRGDGWKVYFSFVLDAADPVGSANTRIAELAAAGYTPNAPGLEAGERTEEITSVCRREFVGRDSKQKRVLDMWAENGQYLQYSHYMDSPADFEAFTLATGMDFDKLPLHKGVAAAARRDPNTEDMIVDLPRPAKVVYKVDGVTDKGKERKEFVRWHGIAPNVTPFPPQTSGDAFDAAFPPNATPEWVKDKKFTDAIFDKANASFSMSKFQVLEALDVKTITAYTGTKEAAFAAIKAYAERRLKEAI
jgi:hypothetical protein